MIKGPPSLKYEADSVDSAAAQGQDAHSLSCPCTQQGPSVSGDGTEPLRLRACVCKYIPNEGLEHAPLSSRLKDIVWRVVFSLIWWFVMN